MSTNMQLGKDINGNVSYDLPFSDLTYYINLPESDNVSLVVPPNCNKAVFSYGTGIDVWVSIMGDITLPTNSFALASGIELNPQAKPVSLGQTLTFLSVLSGFCCVSFYSNAIL